MSCIIRSFRNYGLKINGMCINSITIREKLFGDSIVVWCATFLLVKLFSSKCLHVKKRNERNDVRNTLKYIKRMRTRLRRHNHVGDRVPILYRWKEMKMEKQRYNSHWV